MLNDLSLHRDARKTRRAVMVSACLIAFVAVIALAVRHSQAARLSQQGKSAINDLWQDVGERSIPAGERQIIPSSYRTLRLDLAALNKLLESAPMEFTKAAKEAPVEIAMPMPDGKSSRFKIVESPMMEPTLAEQFPEIKNYRGYGIDDRRATMGFNVTPTGFHAFILSAGVAVAIDPYAKDDTANYISYYKRDDPLENDFRCVVTEAEQSATVRRWHAAPDYQTGSTLHIYRFAVATTGEYTLANGGTVSSALAAINTRVMGVNVILTAEITVTLVLIAEETSIIYTDPNTDPYTSGNLNALAAENHINMSGSIGSNSYDIGQVFDASNAGVASLGSVCSESFKGRGTSGGNSVILAAHEIAHQFGATHTFNDGTNGACGSFNGGNQRQAETAYEPASGSTIMSYCGTCNPADLQPNRDSYYQAFSLIQMKLNTESGDSGGGNCDATLPTFDSLPAIDALPPTQNHIPSLTPFALSVNATDADDDPLTYTWEEFDVGTVSPPEGDDGSRPIFRSYLPSISATRTFPSLPYILGNANVPPPTYNGGGTTYLTGEYLPVTARDMKFVVTVRDGRGAIAQNSTEITVTSHTDSGPFRVTQPNSNVSWAKGAQRTVTWDVASTNTPPINCASVRISLSDNGGFTFPYVLADNTSNDGSESVVLPDIETTLARIKIEAAGNIFFDISDTNFTLRPLSVSTTADNGNNLSPTQGSLREAILDANSKPGLDTISFSLPGGGFSIQTITLTSELPMITSPVILDGWSQGGDGYSGPPLISLDGHNAGSLAHGLTISAGNSTVRGLVIHRFFRDGLHLQTNGGNIIEGCYIGTNDFGQSTQGNGGSGVFMNTPDNRLGSPTTLGQFSRNIIAGNNVGVFISGGAASGNSLYYNYIGTNVNGDVMGNTADGIRITGAPNNQIGGTRSLPGGIFIGTGNVISGNGSDGIEITGGTATGNVIQANFIGLKPDGASALGNFISGIHIEGAANNQIGGTTAAAGNTISGNTNSGGITLIGPGSFGTIIQGNYLGINADGTAAVANNSTDIYVESGNNLIGGTAPGARNVISGSGAGVYLAFAGATGNIIQGNYIGTDASGTVALNSNGEGIGVRGANNNQIGGTTPAARNVISGNGTGIHAVGGTTNLLIQGNYIGTNPAGTSVVGNRFYGLIIEGSTGNTIGGTSAGARNVISGNSTAGGFYGITLLSSSGNTVQGNFIGVNAAGDAALGNGGSGIAVSGTGPSSNNNLIGGTTPGARNVISANARDGILITGNGNVVQGNYIGTDVTGTMNLGNGYSGVEINSGDNNVIGGPGAGMGNSIAFSGVVNSLFGDGVRVAGGITNGELHGIGNRIRGNAIFSNVRLGIEILGGSEAVTGVTANDDCDADTGSNNLQNFPVLTAAASSGINVSVAGTLNSADNTTFTLDFYASPACDATGNGEGQVYLGSTAAATNAACAASFNVTVPGMIAPGWTITATATDPAGNTSEFSACVQATCGYALAPLSQFFTMNGGSGAVNVLAGGGACAWSALASDDWVTITSADSGSGNDTVTFEVRENFTGSARQATINVSGVNHVIVQDGGLGEDCGYSISPLFQSFAGLGGNGTIQVIANERCAWQGVSNVGWVTITSVSVGIGNGSVTYSVAPNPGASGRKGTIIIGAQTFAVKQKGS